MEKKNKMKGGSAPTDIMAIMLIIFVLISGVGIIGFNNDKIREWFDKNYSLLTQREETEKKAQVVQELKKEIEQEELRMKQQEATPGSGPNSWKDNAEKHELAKIIEVLEKQKADVIKKKNVISEQLIESEDENLMMQLGELEQIDQNISAKITQQHLQLNALTLNEQLEKLEKLEKHVNDSETIEAHDRESIDARRYEISRIREQMQEGFKPVDSSLDAILENTDTVKIEEENRLGNELLLVLQEQLRSSEEQLLQVSKQKEESIHAQTRITMANRELEEAAQRRETEIAETREAIDAKQQLIEKEKQEMEFRENKSKLKKQIEDEEVFAVALSVINNTQPKE